MLSTFSLKQVVEDLIINHLKTEYDINTATTCVENAEGKIDKEDWSEGIITIFFNFLDARYVLTITDGLFEFKGSRMADGEEVKVTFFEQMSIFNTIVFMCVTSTLRNIFYEYFSVESV